MPLPKFLHGYSRAKLAAIVLLAVLAIAGALPRYVRGRWLQETRLPSVGTDSLARMRFIAEAGITLSGWETAYQQVVSLGSGDWIMQDLRSTESVEMEGVEDIPEQVVVLLRPQTSDDLQPQVEWTDIKLFIKNLQVPPGQVERVRLMVDSFHDLEFAVPAVGETEEAVRTADARFFRAWTPWQTYGVVQWYAWPDGGHPSLDRWFWADRSARLFGDRIPWVAVTILIPVEPLREIEELDPFVTELAQNIHMALQDKSWSQ